MTYEMFACLSTALGFLALSAGDSSPRLGGKILLATALGLMAWGATGAARALFGALA